MNIPRIRLFTLILGIAMAVLLAVGNDTADWYPRVIALLVLIGCCVVYGMATEAQEPKGLQV